MGSGKKSTRKLFEKRGFRGGSEWEEKIRSKAFASMTSERGGPKKKNARWRRESKKRTRRVKTRAKRKGVSGEGD